MKIEEYYGVRPIRPNATVRLVRGPRPSWRDRLRGLAMDVHEALKLLALWLVLLGILALSFFLLELALRALSSI